MRLHETASESGLRPVSGEGMIVIEMSNKTFIGRVLPDGHLSLPPEASQEVGKTFKVTLVPLDELPDASKWVGRLAELKGLGHLTEEDVQKAIEEVRRSRRP